MERVLEIGILALATWPVIRFVSIPPIRRDFFGIAVAAVGALAIYGIAIATIAVLAPFLLRPFAALAVVLLLYERWRARPSYGRRRGLPPGSLTLIPRRPWVDPQFYIEEAKRFGPIFKSSLLHRPMVCILGSVLGGELFRAHENEIAAIPVRFNRFIPRGFLRYMRRDDHKIYKQLFQSALSPEVLRDHEATIAAVVHESVSAMCERATRDPRGGILPRRDVRDMFFAVLTQLFFALPAASADGRRLYSLYELLDVRKMSVVPGFRDLHTLDDILAILRRRASELEELQARGETPPSCVLTGLVRATPNAAEDETLLRNLVYLLQIGRADLTGLFIWILKQLGDHPEWAARLRTSVRAGSAPADPSLPTRILRETLRLQQSEYVYRRAQEDIVFHDLLIPKGWRIRVLIREGHRDPAVFDDPDRFDPDRFTRSELVGKRLATFGLGAHACIGPQLTETAITIALGELARSFEWQVIEDGPHEYGWAHWEPNSRMRVAFRQSDRWAQSSA